MKTYKDNRRSLFRCRACVVLKDGVIVERYASMNELWRAYPCCNVATLSKRIRRRKDGWLPDGKVARLETEAYEEGTELDVSMMREQPSKRSEAAQVMDEIKECEARIEAAYEDCREGRITFEERHRRTAWDVYHVKMLEERLKKLRS